MNRNKKVPFPVFLLISTILNLILIQLLFLEILPDPESLKDSIERTYIELTEIPVKETEPPDKPARLADKSHRAEKETTRDDTTKLSRSIPKTQRRTRLQKNPREQFNPENRKRAQRGSLPKKTGSP